MKKLIILILILLLNVNIAFAADVKITALSADASPTQDDLTVTVNDPGGSAVNKKATLSAIFNAGLASFDYMTLPSSTLPALTGAGQIGFDTNGWASGRGSMQIHDGTVVNNIVACDGSDTINEGDICKAHTDGTFTWEADNNTAAYSGTDTRCVFVDGTALSDDAGCVYNKTTDSMTLIGALNAATFSTLGTTAGYLQLFEASANGTNFVKFISSTSLASDTTYTFGPGSILSSQGFITLGGTGNTNNESLKLDFETTANKALITSSTSLSELNFGTMQLTANFLAAYGAAGELDVVNTDASGSGAGGSFYFVSDDSAANVSGDRLGIFRFSGVYDNTHTYVDGASIAALAAGTYTSSSSPADMEFRTTPSGSTTKAVRMTIFSTGEVNINSISGDGSGKVVCIKSTGDLGTCSSAVGAGGTCTCG